MALDEGMEKGGGGEGGRLVQQYMVRGGRRPDTNLRPFSRFPGRQLLLVPHGNSCKGDARLCMCAMGVTGLLPPQCNKGAVLQAT